RRPAVTGELLCSRRLVQKITTLWAGCAEGLVTHTRNRRGPGNSSLRWTRRRKGAGFELRVPLPEKRRSDTHHSITWTGAPWPAGVAATRRGTRGSNPFPSLQERVERTSITRAQLDGACTIRR